MSKDYYETLEVSRTASEEEIKKAYKKKALQYHPDRNPGDKQAEESFKEVSEAYSTLRDPQKKEAYNQFGSEYKNFQQGGAGGGNPFAHGGFKNSSGSPFGGGNFKFSDFSTHDLFNEVFGDAFGGFSKGTSRGTDLQFNLFISFEEALKGSVRGINFLRKRNSETNRANLEIKTPPMILENQKLKLKGEGSSERNQDHGDLFVIIRYQKHSIYKKKGFNLELGFSVTFFEAYFGVKKEIPTLSGRLECRIPPRTSSGTILRIPQEGLPQKDKTRGDLWVRVLVDVPQKLSKKSETALKQMEKDLKNSSKVVEFEKKLKK